MQRAIESFPTSCFFPFHLLYYLHLFFLFFHVAHTDSGMKQEPVSSVLLSRGRFDGWSFGVACEQARNNNAELSSPHLSDGKGSCVSRKLLTKARIRYLQYTPCKMPFVCFVAFIARRDCEGGIHRHSW